MVLSWNLQILFLTYSQTKLIVSFASYCLFNPSTVCIFGTNCPISCGVFTKLKPKQLYPNSKCKKKKKKIIFFLTSDSFFLIASQLYKAEILLYTMIPKTHFTQNVTCSLFHGSDHTLVNIRYDWLTKWKYLPEKTISVLRVCESVIFKRAVLIA